MPEEVVTDSIASTSTSIGVLNKPLLLALTVSVRYPMYSRLRCGMFTLYKPETPTCVDVPVAGDCVMDMLAPSPAAVNGLALALIPAGNWIVTWNERRNSLALGRAHKYTRIVPVPTW